MDKATGKFHRHGNHPHIHKSEQYEQNLLELVNEAVNMIANAGLGVSNREIFDRVRERYPGVEAAFDGAMQKRLQVAKRLIQPPIPSSVEQMAEFITSPNYAKTYSHNLDQTQEFFTALVHEGGDGDGKALVFTSPNLLKQLGEREELHADGTFKAAPRLFYQLFTVHIILKKKSFPVVYALMTNKTRALYDAVLSAVTSKYAALYPEKGFKVKHLMSDFETAIMDSMKHAFNATPVGCHFHYAQV